MNLDNSKLGSVCLPWFWIMNCTFLTNTVWLYFLKLILPKRITKNQGETKYLKMEYHKYEFSNSHLSSVINISVTFLLIYFFYPQKRPKSTFLLNYHSIPLRKFNFVLFLILIGCTFWNWMLPIKIKQGRSSKNKNDSLWYSDYIFKRIW